MFLCSFLIECELLNAKALSDHHLSRDTPLETALQRAQAIYKILQKVHANGNGHISVATLKQHLITCDSMVDQVRINGSNDGTVGGRFWNALLAVDLGEEYQRRADKRGAVAARLRRHVPPGHQASTSGRISPPSIGRVRHYVFRSLRRLQGILKSYRSTWCS